MITLIFWWVMLAAAVLWLSIRRGRESPLLLTYFFSLSMIHVPGALNYTGQSVRLFHERETFAGFRLTLIGLSVMLLTVLGLRVLRLAEVGNVSTKAEEMSMQTVYRVMLVGAIIYFVLTPVASLLPSGTALASTLAGLLPMGFWFWAKNASTSERPWPEFARILAVASLLPVATLLVSGFLGFGVSLMLTIGAMVLVVWPRKWPLILSMPVLAYLGMSLGASYFMQRDEIRSAVWGEEDYESRVEASLGIFTDFRFYDVNDPDTVQAVESRLNQNFLIGIGLQSHANGFSELQYGATVPLWSLVPRVLWPDKPQVGGGGMVVADFTGITFSEGTSVGVGNPFEFYINFGWPGVVGGFMLLGVLLAWHDQRLMLGVNRCDIRQVILYGLPGLTLINPGGNLLEVTVSFVAAQFVARGFLVALSSPLVARMLGFNAVILAQTPIVPISRTARQER